MNEQDQGKKFKSKVFIGQDGSEQVIETCGSGNRIGLSTVNGTQSSTNSDLYSYRQRRFNKVTSETEDFNKTMTRAEKMEGCSNVQQDFKLQSPSENEDPKTVNNECHDFFISRQLSFSDGENSASASVSTNISSSQDSKPKSCIRLADADGDDDDCGSESTDSWIDDERDSYESEPFLRSVPLDMTLHTICEESETESECRKTSPKNPRVVTSISNAGIGLEQYFQYADGSSLNPGDFGESEYSDSFSEESYEHATTTSSSSRRSTVSVGIAGYDKDMEDFPEDRDGILEDYFLSFGEDDEDDSRESSESGKYVEATYDLRRRKLRKRVNGNSLSHSKSDDSDSSNECSDESELAFEQDGYDTIKRIRKNKRSREDLLKDEAGGSGAETPHGFYHSVKVFKPEASSSKTEETRTYSDLKSDFIPREGTSMDGSILNPYHISLSHTKIGSCTDQTNFLENPKNGSPSAISLTTNDYDDIRSTVLLKASTERLNYKVDDSKEEIISSQRLKDCPRSLLSCHHDDLSDPQQEHDSHLLTETCINSLHESFSSKASLSKSDDDEREDRTTASNSRSITPNTVKSARYRPPGYFDGSSREQPRVSTPILRHHHDRFKKFDDISLRKNNESTNGTFVQNSCSTIEFSMQYNYKISSFEVIIKQCKNLKQLAEAQKPKSRVDPYVKAYLLPDRSKGSKRKTKTRKNTSNPIFAEVLKFQVLLDDLDHRILWLSVWHCSDMFGKNEFLGQLIVPLKGMSFDDPTIKSYPLQLEKISVEKLLDTGEDPITLILALKWIPKGYRTQHGTLQVLIKEAKGLQKQYNKNSLPSTFIKCVPMNDKSKKQKTIVARRTLSPVWNSTLVFENVNLNDGIDVSIYSFDLLLRTHEQLANLKLNCDSELWRNMVKRQEFWVEGLVKLTSCSSPIPSC